MRLFVDAALAAGAELALPPGAARHAQVRRVQPGDELLLFDGRGSDWPARVLAVGRSEVRVLTASFKPGDKTVSHTHDYPVTVYVVEGAFTLELKGQPAKTIKAGEAMVEPPNTEMTGYNRSATEETKVVIFYVSTPDGPFLKPLK